MPNTPVMDGLIRRTVQRHLPWSVHVDLTYRCNERCIHCYLDHEDHGEMKTQEIKNVLEQLAQTGTLFLTFSGGEIFLRADLFELLEFARSLHFDISLKTNALLIDSERARKLRELSVRKIQISIYSAEPEVHDAITKVRGSLERTLAAIRFLQAEGLQVKIACPADEAEPDRLSKRASARGGTRCPLRPGHDHYSENGRRYESSAVAQLDQRIVAHFAGCEPESAGMFAEQFGSGRRISTGSTTSSGMESQAYEDIPCSAGHNSCYISPYGDVFPCVQMPVATGNLRKQTFEDIWFRSEEMNRVRAVRESQLPICSKCSIRQYCERCPGLAQMEGGDLLGAYERACELAELNARIAGVRNPVSAMHAEKSNSKNSCSIPVPTIAPEVRIGSN